MSAHGFTTLGVTLGRIPSERYSTKQQSACLTNWRWMQCLDPWTQYLNFDILNSLYRATRDECYIYVFSVFQHITPLGKKKNISCLPNLAVSPSPSPLHFWFVLAGSYFSPQRFFCCGLLFGWGLQFSAHQRDQSLLTQRPLNQGFKSKTRQHWRMNFDIRCNMKRTITIRAWHNDASGYKKK